MTFVIIYFLVLTYTQFDIFNNLAVFKTLQKKLLSCAFTGKWTVVNFAQPPPISHG